MKKYKIGNAECYGLLIEFTYLKTGNSFRYNIKVNNTEEAFNLINSINEFIRNPTVNGSLSLPHIVCSEDLKYYIRMAFISTNFLQKMRITVLEDMEINDKDELTIKIEDENSNSL